MFQFKLPDLGEGIHEGEILKWYVEPGQQIAEDDPLVEIETDKAAVTIPTPVAGRVLLVAATVGEIVAVGQVIVEIDTSARDQIKKAIKERAAMQQRVDSPTNPVHQPDAAASSSPIARSTPVAAPQNAVSTHPIPAAPATRRLARELGVDLKSIKATGPGGRVTTGDVRGFVEQDVRPKYRHQDSLPSVDQPLPFANLPFLDLKPLPDFERWGEVEKIPLRSIRRKVAYKMVTSMILVPHVAHMDEADVTRLEELRVQQKKRRAGQPGGKLTILAFVIKAISAGLKAAPSFNASLDPHTKEIIFKKYYNIGIAADSDRGLVVPVVKGTDRKSIIQISSDIEDLVERARVGKLELDEIQGGTFTITNIGPLGGTALIPTINYPEVAILGMGKVQEKPVVRNGKIVIRKILPLTLAFDHRIADGADAARFVSAIVRQLSDPNRLLLEA